MEAEKTETPKRALTRDAIWNAALRLFAENGFDQTTVEEIATAAGVARRTFFRQFESKSDLMSYPVIRYGISITTAIKECPQETSLSALFRYVVGHVAQQTTVDPRIRKLMAIAATQRSAREAQLSGVTDLQDRVAMAFAARGLEPITAGVMAELTISTLSMAYRIWYRSQRRGVAAALEQVLSTLSQVVCQDGKRGSSMGGGKLVTRLTFEQVPD
jgi:TetR/AcrR family transcriptional regulator, regulator of mycofactocin system